MLRLTGYVKNEFDGSVICEIQGKEYEIDRFLSILQSARYIEIDRMEKTKLSAENDERAFHVKY